MTVNCARCHNHKFDPILQARFLPPAGGLRRRQGQGRRDRDAGRKGRMGGCADKAYKERLDAHRRRAQSARQAYDDQIMAERKAKLDPKLLEALEHSERQAHARTEDASRPNAEAQIKPTWDEVVAVMPPDGKGRTRAACASDCIEIEATAPDPLPTAYAFVNTGEAAPQSYVLRMGDPHNRLDPVDPAVPCVIQAGYRDSHGIARAAAPRFANWLASPRESADRARHGQSHLAVPHGRRHGAHAQRFRHHGRQARESRAARLAGRGVHGPRLERQGHGPADRDVQRLPAVVGSRRREGQDRSREPALLAHEPQTLRCRNDPRRGALRRRHAQSARSAGAPCAFRSSPKSTT